MSKCNKTIVNAMTVDVEDYFHVSAFENVIDKKSWNNLPLRVEANTHRLLEIYEQHNTKCTFFTLGWVAEKCPALIKEIVAQGHELASHGYNHKRTTIMSPEDVKDDIYRSKALLEDLAGKEILGYRAPSFSINDSNVWLYDILVELGFKYSSSTYPIQHDLYGVPQWPRFAYQRPEGLLEIPIPTIIKKEKNVGIGGGGFFRLYPYWLSQQRINHFHNVEKQPYSFYFHPWEIDPDQPRIKNAPLKSKLRHYLNLSSMEGKLVKLLEDYKWSTMEDIYLGDKSV